MLAHHYAEAVRPEDADSLGQTRTRGRARYAARRSRGCRGPPSWPSPATSSTRHRAAPSARSGSRARAGAVSCRGPVGRASGLKYERGFFAAMNTRSSSRGTTRDTRRALPPPSRSRRSCAPACGRRHPGTRDRRAPGSRGRSSTRAASTRGRTKALVAITFAEIGGLGRGDLGGGLRDSRGAWTTRRSRRWRSTAQQRGGDRREPGLRGGVGVQPAPARAGRHADRSPVTRGHPAVADPGVGNPPPAASTPPVILRGRTDEVTSPLSAHHRVHGVSAGLVEVAELLGDWPAIRAIAGRVRDAVAANVDTPCTRNARSLLIWRTGRVRSWGTTSTPARAGARARSTSGCRRAT